MFPKSKIKKMDCVFGLVGKDFALVVAGASVVDGIFFHQFNEDKVMTLDSNKLMVASGENSDILEITKSIKMKVPLYRLRYGIPMTTSATANFTRGELATALHKRPYMVNVVLAGYDKETGPSLYSIDYIATLHKVDKAAFGDGAFVSLVMTDCHCRSDMSVEEAVHLVKKCIHEMNSSLVMAPPNFVIKIVDKDGSRTHSCQQICLPPNFVTPTFEHSPTFEPPEPAKKDENSSEVEENIESREANEVKLRVKTV